MKINREIALEGAVLKAVSPLPSERVQRLIGPLSTKAMSLWRLKRLNCKKEKITRKDGSAFRVCIFRGKKAEGKTVGVLWLHGGGYAIAGPEMVCLSFPRHLINNCNCVVVAPDYTLSTIKPYPAALEDAYLTLEWLKENRERLGIDYEKIAVGGESAGGGLTAALCLYARDKGDGCIGFQMPLYPMLDDRVTETSYNNTAPVWNTKANKAAWRIYLGDSVMNNSAPKYAAPARETDFSHLPPAVSVIGTAEPFYAETKAFFERLGEQGTEAQLREFEGAYHAFDMLAPYAKISREANAFLLEKYEEFSEKYIK